MEGDCFTRKHWPFLLHSAETHEASEHNSLSFDSSKLKVRSPFVNVMVEVELEMAYPLDHVEELVTRPKIDGLL